jgi:hypothetical protein
MTRRLRNIIMYNQAIYRECDELEYPIYGARNRSLLEQDCPLYGGTLVYLNETIPVLEPLHLPHHHRHLNQTFKNETSDLEKNIVTHLDRVTDERDVTQAISDMEDLWQWNLGEGYRQDPIYKLAFDSSKTQKGGQMQQ